jgi:hypothetical protein
MGELVDRVKINMLVYGNGIAENYKNNTLYFYNAYLKSSPEVKLVQAKDIWYGRFYFFHYLDKSDWMKYSPVYVADFKKFGNKIILYCVNLNFLPLELRVAFFDNFMIEQDFIKNDFLKVKMQEVYNKLRSMYFEYALMEFDASHIRMVHQIHLDILPRFIISGHPKVIYDPKKLRDISTTKIKDSDKRHKEMMNSLASDFFETTKEIPEKYQTLKKHIQRLRNNSIRYSNISRKK